MKILGISGSLDYEYNHDCAAALVIDGKLIANYEEERFNRIKHSFKKPFPILSIQKILSENNLTLNDIDIIAIPHDPRDKQVYLKRIVEVIDNKTTKFPDLFYIDHHSAHVCDSFFQSGFKSAAALIIDGNGDNKDGITIAKINDSELTVLKKYSHEVSLGKMYYAASTVFARLGEFGEGKFMGLSSYGIPNQKPILEFKDNEIIKNFKNIVNDDIIKNMFLFYKMYNYPYVEKIDNDILYYINFAATVQKTYNNIIIELARYTKKLTNENNLILSGGCIQNCIGNNIIIESKLFDNVFAGPVPYDAGCAAGLAFHAAFVNKEKIINNRLYTSYAGKKYKIKIEQYKEKYNIKEYQEDFVISALKNNKIIAWFQDGSEIGPRALGHRSILGNPANRKTLDIINNELKHRENWRPLAPIVPDITFDLIFDVQSYDLTEFMLRTLKIREEFQRKIPAVCHVDGTTRPQRLTKIQNPELYSLLISFYNNTKIPCLINTSFNDKNQPIIETPEQALEFLDVHPHLDFIVFNAKYIITRKEV